MISLAEVFQRLTRSELLPDVFETVGKALETFPLFERGNGSRECLDRGDGFFNCHKSILSEIAGKSKLYFHLFALALAPSKVAQTADLVKEIGGEHLTVKPIMALTGESASTGDD